MVLRARHVLVAAFLLRFLLIIFGLYRSTDFEVHRNWLAITHSLPLSRWYFEETSPWTLDYPPLFAYFEWALSQVAALVDPDMLRVNNLEYASTATVAFQRVSVIFGDLLLAAGVWRVAGAKDAAVPLALVLFNPALIIVDHIHFQYNGMLLGVLLLSAADVEAGNVLRGSMLFSALLCAKQIFLYAAPVYFVYLLKTHCWGSLTCRSATWSLRLLPLAELGATVVATICASLMPICWTGQAFQMVSRLFPFGRGLTHAYWAPNVWALYNTADRVLCKLGLGQGVLRSSTAGMAEVYESSVLWTVPPKATFALTALAYIPLACLVWRHSPGMSRAQGTQALVAQRGTFAVYVALGCAVSFSFGWHVHEKAILMVTVPLLATVGCSNNKDLVVATAGLSAAATFSVLPLLPQRPVETAVKWLLFAGHFLEFQLLRRCCSGKPDAPARHGKLSGMRMFGVWPIPGAIVVSAYVVLSLYNDGGLHRYLFSGRMEFLPLLIISDFSTVLVLGSFLRLFNILSSRGCWGCSDHES